MRGRSTTGRDLRRRAPSAAPQNRATKRVVLWAALWCPIATLGYVTTTQALVYLPPFALGALLASNYDELRRSGERLAQTTRGRLTWRTVAVAGPFLLVAYWMLRPLTSGPWSEITLSLRVAGAFAIVATVAFWLRARTPRIPSRPALGHLLACLGSVSFSLYLVHFPIVVAGALLAGPGRWWLGALISVPLSLLIAQLMTTWVEQPAQKYGTRAGASVSQRIPRPARPTRV